MLVNPEFLPDLSVCPCFMIEDRYLDAGRLRLRKATPLGSDETVYKLCKKYGPITAYEEPIVNIYLSAGEYEALRLLPGRDLRKRRYKYDYQGRTFSIDEHSGALSGLYLCEIESISTADLLTVTFPPFAVRDVAGEAAYSGAGLATAAGIPAD